VSRSGWSRDFIYWSSTVVLSKGIDRIRGLDNVVFVECFYKIVNVRSYDLDVHPEGAAYFVDDAWFVLPLL
jgi:hypothetical protein